MLFERWRWYRAAKIYGERLGPHLSEDYGGEPPYTQEQVDKAIGKLVLNPRYAALGYAAFLTISDFGRLRRANPKLLDREVALVLVARFGTWSPAASDRFDDPRGFSGISGRYTSY